MKYKAIAQPVSITRLTADLVKSGMKVPFSFASYDFSLISRGDRSLGLTAPEGLTSQHDIRRVAMALPRH